MGDRGAISTLVAHQHGHITRAQLLELGLGAQAITYRVRSGELVRIHAGVYAAQYPRVEPVARAMAALLASGEGAVLSHDSAAALWGLRRWPDIPEVTAPHLSDKPRDNHNLANGGYRTMRIAPNRLTDAKADELRAILGASRDDPPSDPTPPSDHRPPSASSP